MDADALLQSRDVTPDPSRPAASHQGFTARVRAVSRLIFMKARGATTEPDPDASTSPPPTDPPTDMVPVTPPPVASVRVKAGIDVAPAETTPRKVLVVDDHPDTAESLAV